MYFRVLPYDFTGAPEHKWRTTQKAEAGDLQRGGKGWVAVMILERLNSHVFLQAAEGRFLIDTGAPASFGMTGHITIGDREFSLEPGYLGLDAARLGDLVGIEVAGLVGTDILNCFDIRLDLAGGRIEVTEETLDMGEREVPLTFCLGVPIIPVEAGEKTCNFVFDTGAQLSYWQDEGLSAFRPAGQAADFHPSFPPASFIIETHMVAMRVGGEFFELRCGRLPAAYAAVLGGIGASGILGADFLEMREVFYLPRRKRLSFATRSDKT